MNLLPNEHDDSAELEPDLLTKKCNKCGESKPLDDFHKKSANRDGRDTRCKSCVNGVKVKNNPPTDEPKCCTICREVKPATEFSINRRSRDGRSFDCRECQSKRQKLYREENRQQISARRRADYAENAEARRASGRAYYAANPDANWARNIKKKYGLTPDDYYRILDSQLGLCANPGCFNAPIEGQERFHVDHDHACCPGDRSCGRCIRGILCPGCNKALGCARDDVKRLRGLADYLESADRVDP